jgi:hypothetical protein
MNFKFKSGQYNPSSLMRAVNIFLLALIVAGVVLLCTQKIWVPKVVQSILERNGEMVDTKGGDSAERNKWLSASVYKDDEAGFYLQMPLLWQQLSYQINREVKEGGLIEYTLTLPYKDKQGDLRNGIATSLLVAIPKSLEENYKVSADEANTYNEQILGENQQYVFISRQFSPEAFGECDADNLFYQANISLCEAGSDLRNPERKAGVFQLK